MASDCDFLKFHWFLFVFWVIWSIKTDFQAFYIYWESKLEIDRQTSVWEPDKKNSSVWRHAPLSFFVSFFRVLFALKNSGLKVDEVLKKIDFNDFGPFSGPKNAFFTRLRRFLNLMVMLIAFAFKFPTI